MAQCRRATSAGQESAESKSQKSETASWIQCSMKSKGFLRCFLPLQQIVVLDNFVIQLSKPFQVLERKYQTEHLYGGNRKPKPSNIADLGWRESPCQWCNCSHILLLLLLSSFEWICNHTSLSAVLWFAIIILNYNTKWNACFLTHCHKLWCYIHQQILSFGFFIPMKTFLF